MATKDAIKRRLDVSNAEKKAAVKEYGNVEYADECLVGDTLVYTSCGGVKISEIKTGDKVYSFDGDIKEFEGPLKRGLRCYKRKRLYGKLREAVITEAKNKGISPIIGIKTCFSELKGSPNHLLLTVKRDKDGGGRRLEWISLGDIQVGDLVVVACRLPEPSDAVHKNLDEMRFLGFWLGDGWLHKESRNQNGFSRVSLACANEEEAQKYAELAQKIWPQTNPKVHKHHQETNKCYIVDINSTEVAGYIASLGFGEGARNKCIPSWVFGVDNEGIKSFLEGLFDADGYRDVYKTTKGIEKEFYVIHMANKQILQAIKLLALRLGWWSDNIHEREQSPSKLIPNKGQIYSLRVRPYYRPAALVWGGKKLLAEGTEVTAVRVRGKWEEEPQEVYDVTVEPDHVFVANGYITHNSNKKYPLDKEHIYAAIRYWGMPRNRAKYSPEEQAAITRRIAQAAKKFGVDAPSLKQ